MLINTSFMVWVEHYIPLILRVCGLTGNRWLLTLRSWVPGACSLCGCAQGWVGSGARAAGPVGTWPPSAQSTHLQMVFDGYVHRCPGVTRIWCARSSHALCFLRCPFAPSLHFCALCAVEADLCRWHRPGHLLPLDFLGVSAHRRQGVCFPPRLPGGDPTAPAGFRLRGGRGFPLMPREPSPPLVRFSAHIFG